MTLEMLRKNGPPIILQYGRFYCNLPPNIESLEFAIKWLQFWVDYLKKQEENENRDSTPTPTKEDK